MERVSHENSSNDLQTAGIPGAQPEYDLVIALSLGYATDTKEAHDLREEKISRI